MLVLKKDIGSFLNKTSHLCVCRGLDCDGDCLPPTQLVFFVAQKKKSTCLTQDGTLDWKPVSGTTLRSSHCGLCLLLHLDWFSGPRSASAIPIPGSYQLPPPPQPLGCPLLWGLDAEEDENIPTALALYCQNKMSTPYLWQAHCELMGGGRGPWFSKWVLLTWTEAQTSLYMSSSLMVMAL